MLYADVPLIQAASLSALAGKLDKKTPVAVLGFEAADPHGYGRLLKAKNGSIRAIREELDASPQEKKIRLCNSGILSVNSNVLWKLLPQIKNENAKREYYLTDLVELAAKAGLRVGLVTCPEAEVAGVNDRVQLAAIEAESAGAVSARCDARRGHTGGAGYGLFFSGYQDRHGRGY